MTDIFINKSEGYNFEILITAPAYDFNETFIGVIAFEVNMEPVYKLIQDTTGLGETGETLIASNNGDHALFLNTLRYDQESALKKIVNFADENANSQASQHLNFQLLANRQ